MQVAAQILTTIAGYVVAVVLARQLGPGIFGAYAIVYSVLLTAEIVGRLGVPQALTKLVAEKFEGRASMEATGALIGAIIYLGIFLVFRLAAPWLAGSLGMPDQVGYFLLASWDIPLYGMFFVVNAILNGRQDYHLAAMTVAFYALSRMGAIAVLVVIGTTIEGALIANVAASAIGLTVAMIAVRWIRARPSGAAAKAVWTLAVPLSVRGVSNQVLAGIGLWALGAAGVAISGDAKGLYAAANSIARLPVILALGVSSIIVASIASALGRGDRAAALAILSGVTRALFIVLVPTTMILMIEGDNVMRLLFSEPYAAGGAILAILVVGQGMAFTFMNVLNGAVIAASRPGKVVITGLYGVVAAALGVTALVPAYGAIGAALGTAFGSIVAAIAAGVFAWRFIGNWLQPSNLLTLCLASLPIALAAFMIDTRDLGFVIEIAALGLAQLALFATLGIITMSDARLLLGKTPEAAATRPPES